MSAINSSPLQKGSALEVFKTFLVLGLTSFGGPVAHLAYFHRELVARRAWVSESQFTQLLAVCQFLPGPASSQLGFSLGLLRAGWLGALAAFLAFTLPSALLLVVFASVLPFISGGIGLAAIHGLKLVACAVFADAVLAMSKKLCPDLARRAIAILTLAALLFFDSVWSQVLVVFGGALAGMAVCQAGALESQVHLALSYGKRGGLMFLSLFALVFAAFYLQSSGSSLASIAEVFYHAGSMVFGGGHVVLPLLEDSVVATALVSKDEFLAGYGAAQAIPGPMFAFAAYLGAIIPTEHVSWLGASVALLFMFLPGFLLLLAALPLWQAVSHNKRAANAISGVNAAVVGLLAAALYDPIFSSGISSTIDLTIAALAFAMLAIWKRSPLLVVLWCVFASIVVSVASAMA